MSDNKSNKDQISTKMLIKDMINYKILQSRAYSPSVHRKLSDLKCHVYRVLDAFEDGDFVVRSDQQKLFARYIDVVGGNGKRRFFGKLQETADFDVRDYVRRINRKWWQKLFNISPYAKYKPANELQDMVNIYEVEQNKAYRSSIENYGKTKKMDKVRHNAKRYIRAYLDGDFAVRPEDVEGFKEFVEEFCDSVYDKELRDSVLSRLEKASSEVQVNAEVEYAKKSWWKSQPKFFKTCAHGISSAGRQIASKASLAYNSAINNVSDLWSNAKDKMSVISKRKNKIMIYGSALCLTLGLAFVGGKQVKKAYSAENAELQTELNSLGVDQNAVKEDSTVHWQSVALMQVEKSDTMQERLGTESAVTMNVSRVTKVIETNEATAKQTVKEESLKNDNKISKQSVGDSAVINYHKAVINHHEHVIKMHLSKRGAEELCNHIREQIKDGIYALPQGMNEVHFAYALVMYRSYGVQSSLESAYKSKVKLTKEQVQKIAKDITDAGDTGLGVKKMAEQKCGGKLNRGSWYDKSSKKSQHQHNMNLKQWRMAKKMVNNA